MHVAYLLPVHPYASCTFIRREIVELEKLGFQISRFAVRRPEHPLTDEADRAEESRTSWILASGLLALVGNVLRVFATRPGHFLRALRLAFKCSRRSDRGPLVQLAYLVEACTALRWIEARGVEHVHCHFATNAVAIAMLVRELGGPTYSFTVHGPDDFDLAHSISLDEKIGRARFVIAISHFARSQLFRWCGHRDWPKIRIVRCGVTEAFLQAPRTPPPVKPRFLCIGRLSAQKGQLLLVEAANQLNRDGVAFTIDIVGDGEMRKPLEALIARYGLGDKVRLLGWRSEIEVRGYLQESRALVLPSFAEGLPVVIMEAFALGRPVITTTIAGIPELVESGVSGWLIPPGSVEALVSAIRTAAAATPALLAEMGRAGAEVVARQHNVATEAKKLAALYHSALPDLDAPTPGLEDHRGADFQVSIKPSR